MENPGVNVLLLEDEEGDSFLFGMAVEDAHVNVTLRTVTDGRGGMDYFSGKGVYRDRREYPSPDVIVLDLRMRGVSGVDFLRWRHTDAKCRDVPAVVLTGAIQGDFEIQTALANGATRAFFKPASVHDLGVVVREIYQIGLEHAENSKAIGDEARSAAA